MMSIGPITIHGVGQTKTAGGITYIGGEDFSISCPISGADLDEMKWIELRVPSSPDRFEYDARKDTLQSSIEGKTISGFIVPLTIVSGSLVDTFVININLLPQVPHEGEDPIAGIETITILGLPSGFPPNKATTPTPVTGAVNTKTSLNKLVWVNP
jgi:hypothetical protein